MNYELLTTLTTFKFYFKQKKRGRNLPLFQIKLLIVILPI
jgi:hypothetical protein